jgi:hypothetical protein
MGLSRARASQTIGEMSRQGSEGGRRARVIGLFSGLHVEGTCDPIPLLAGHGGRQWCGELVTAIWGPLPPSRFPYTDTLLLWLPGVRRRW